MPERTPDPALARFAAALSRLREAGGWNRYRLAAAAKVSQVELTRMEAGERNVTLATLCRLADALGVTLDELAGRIE